MNLQNKPAKCGLHLYLTSTQIEKRKIYLQTFIDKAKNHGNKKEFLDLLNVLDNFPLFCYLNPKYQVIKYSSQDKHTDGVIWLGPNLYFEIDSLKMSKLPGLSKKMIEEHVITENKIIRRENVGKQIALLKNLLSKIKK